MNDNDEPTLRDLSDEELAGWTELVLSDGPMPAASNNVLAYVARIEAATNIDRNAVVDAARRARATVISRRLRDAKPSPVRPFGAHILATRLAAGLGVADVAALLRERVSSLMSIEKREAPLFELPTARIAAIVRVFGFTEPELRQALMLELTDPATATPGLVFPRASDETDSASTLRLAADDLRRVAANEGTKKSDAAHHQLVDDTVRAVRRELQPGEVPTID